MLTAPTRLGPYEIVSALGAGGMGEVYRARDSRLGRDVAIKVLPSDVASDPERRSRFEREARAVAALDHPNICGIYDVGEANGTHYLVMPLLDGQTLAARLERGPLPIAEALKIAGEIADALDKAHRQGIVHRDLKPANVMLTKLGAGSSGSAQVKLLDFGLAKLRPTRGAVSLGTNGLQTATTSVGTAEGTILGTIHYMAPEHVEGKDADHRADIWALGVVIYEMVAGARPFDGESAASVLGSILKETAMPLSMRQALAPVALDHVVRRCLAKLPEERWQTASDLRSALELVPDTAHSPERLPSGTSQRARSRGLLPATAGLLLFAAGAWFGTRTFAPAIAPAPVVQFDIQPPVDVMLSPAPVAGTPQIALSPDGRQIAFVGMRRRGTSQIYVRSFDNRDARPLAGTENATFPFWSPDSQHLAFFANGKLMRIAVAGGASQVVCGAPAGRGGTWGPNSTIVFSPFPNAGLQSVSASGGEPLPLTRVDRSEGPPHERVVGHNWPQFLPDGRHVLFYQRTANPQLQGVYVSELGSDAPPRMLRALNGISQQSSGYLAWVRDGVLMAQPLDEQTQQLSGEPVQVADRVAYFSGSFGYSAFSASAAGLLAYGPPIGTVTALRWYSRTGQPSGQLGAAGVYFSPRLSPDGTLVTVARAGETMTERDLWNLDVARGSVSRVTSDPAADWFPAWAPTRLYFGSTRTGLTSLFQKVGVSPEVLVASPNYATYPSDVSARAAALVVQQSTERGYDLGIVNLDGEPTPGPFLSTEFNEIQARFAPNGRWIAYVSDESGQFDVYVRPYPAGNTLQVKVSPAGGMQPEWRRDGKELYYVSADGKMMAVSVSTDGATFDAQGLQPLFDVETPEAVAPYPTHYAVTADGSRFLVNTVVDQPVRPAITVIMNWTQALRK